MGEKIDYQDFKPYDIRPDNNVDRYYQIYNEEVENLLDPNTGMVRDELLQEISCPICGTKQRELLFIKHGVNITRCKGCSYVYINPRLKQKYMLDFISHSKALQYFTENIYIPTRQVRKDKIFRSRVQLLKNYLTSGKILDIGCGVGEFLECLYEEGFTDLTGIEPSESAARFLINKFKFNILNSSFESADLKNDEYSAVTLWGVIPDVYDPYIVLKKCYRVLKNDGYLFISTPNVEGFEYKILKDKNLNFALHLQNYFSDRTIVNILEKSGFRKECINVTTPGKLDVENVRRELLKYPNEILIDDWLKDILLDDGELGVQRRANLQEYIAENNLSGHMLIVAKK